MNGEVNSPLSSGNSEDQYGWIEQNFEKLECAGFVACVGTETQCQCGRQPDAHVEETGEESVGVHHRSIASPTDAFGTIEFLGGLHPCSAQYIRLAFDSRPSLIAQLLTEEWRLGHPKLAISVRGGKANFKLNPQLHRALQEGLLGAAKSTSGWILTGGTNTGVTHHVGDALASDRAARQSDRVVCIGIAPWGIANNRKSLIGRKKDVRLENPSLNIHHDAFLLVDDGTVGQGGAEMTFRMSLEKYISNQRLPGRSDCPIPVVCLVVDGGMRTIKTVLEYVTDSPPIPVVILEGSGRAADLIAFAHKNTKETAEVSVMDGMRDQLMTAIYLTFNIQQSQAEKLFDEILQCVRRKNLITVFRLGTNSSATSDVVTHGHRLDHAILSAFFRARQLSTVEQLDYALAWDRFDVMEHSVIDALVNNRVDVVKLLLDAGMPMMKFLTVPRLEKLYNSEKDPKKGLRFILSDLPMRKTSVTLKDVDSVIKKFMGGAYHSSYSNSIGDDSRVFRQPFNELLVWSVLTKRQSMAKLMWQHGEEALAKALVASKLYKAMAIEAKKDDNLEMEIAELNNYSAEFAREALDLLDYCFRRDDDLAQQLLTCEMPNWSHRSCLGLAFTCCHREFLAHPCAQFFLGDLWLGGLRTRRYKNLKVLTALIFFPLILCLEFKSKEEIQRLRLKQDLNKFTRRMNNRGRDGISRMKTISISYASAQNSDNEDVEMAGEVQQQQPFSLTGWPSGDQKLPKQRKFFEFYTAPITTYWSWSIAYCVFLFFYTYTLLIRTLPTPEWNEIYVILFVATFGCEKVREILISEPLKLRKKFTVWMSNGWNFCDAFFIPMFFIGMTLRLQENTMDIGRVLYCLNIVYWYIRILVILRVSQLIGPYLTMIGRMVEKTMSYIILMLVVLMSYGVFRQSLLFPNEEFSWLLVRDIFFKPYFMIYGELFADSIDPPCGNGTNSDGSFDPDMLPCVTGRWLNPLVMTAYLIVVCILLVNLLIAIFNSVFQRMEGNSHTIWKFHQYAVLINYQEKPEMPPPLVAFQHFYFVVKWCHRKRMLLAVNDLWVRLIRLKGLTKFFAVWQLWLSKDELEKQHKFEKESLKGLIREREAQKNQTTDERVRLIGERLDALCSKMECSNVPDNNSCLDSFESRLAVLEKAVERRIPLNQGFNNQSDSHGSMTPTRSSLTSNGIRTSFHHFSDGRVRKKTEMVNTSDSVVTRDLDDDCSKPLDEMEQRE